MIDYSKPRLAFRKPLLAVLKNYEPTPRVAWENRVFEPLLSDTFWIRETFFPVMEDQVANDQLCLTAMIQYDVFAQKGTGTEKLEALALAVANCYPANASFVDGTTQIAIDRCERKGLADGGNPGRDPTTSSGGVAWVFIPVVVTWRTYAIN